MEDQRLLRAAGDPNQIIGMSEKDLRRLVVLKGISTNRDPYEMDRKELVRMLLSTPIGQSKPPQPMVQTRGKKRALLIGINYQGTRSQLNGCITDTRFMHYCLLNKFGFAKEDILMLNEEQHNPYQIPTRENIFRGMQWLLTGVRNGDSLVFMYSGHGDQIRDHTGEEIDGLCETILPLDHQRAGPIADKELYKYLIQPLPPGTKLHALCDSCHSGTILDLPYTVMPQKEQTSWNSNPWHPAQRVFKGTSGGLAVCISGCRDDQTSADTRQMSSGQASTGAMLYSFIQSVEHGRARTYGELLFSMRDIIDHALKHGFDWGGTLMNVGIATMLGGTTYGMLSAAPALATAFTGGSNVQVPQMSSSSEFDLRTPFQI